MKRAALSGLLVSLLLAVPAVSAAQECGPSRVSVGWTQPNNVAITSQNAIRWPTTATMRIAYGGTWCPELAKFSLVDEDGEEIPAQLRFRTPMNLVENAPTPLTVIDIDPIPELKTRHDYFLTLELPEDSLIQNYNLEFRTSGGAMEPIGDFEGVLAVEPASDRCDVGFYFVPQNADVPQCLVPTHLTLNVTYQPLDRADVSYAVYRVSTTPLDPESGEPIEAEADDEELLVHMDPGTRDVLGAGIPVRGVPVKVLYTPIPRRDCFSVRLVDEWGRERGDLENRACIDLLPLPPCPDGCMGMECMIVFPEPNPFEVNDPISGQVCENLGLNGGDPDRPIPPPPVDGEDPPDMGAGGETDGGMNDSDGGAGGGDAGGEGGSGGGGGCNTTSAGPMGLGWLLFALPLLIRRRRQLR